MQHLRSLIAAADLASKNVAPGAETSTSTLSRNLSGDRLPQRSTVEAIIQLCGVTDEVRAQLLRMHTAALGEAHPAFADRLVMADAYEETVLLHDRVQARLETVTGEHRRQQADYDDLLARHETTSQALTAAEDELCTRQQHHQQETARLRTLLQEEQDARRRDRTDFDDQFHQARVEGEEQLRGREEEEARLRQDLLAQENKIQAVRSLLEDSAAEASALRQERDQLRVESARLREDLVGLQVELAAAEAEQEKQGRHDEDTMFAPALQAVGQVLDRHPAAREDGEAAGKSRVAGAATQATAGAGNPVPPPAAAGPATPPESTEAGFAGLARVAVGTVVVSLVLFVIGQFQQAPGSSDLTTAGWWFTGSGFFLFVTSLIPLVVREMRNNPVVPGETDDQTYGYPPMG
ncbi:hypothetical protein OG429_40275 (plasmid) [Streptomyces sp. NBC_00190]|uniref:helix-turn-helix domain-containing protein n=1 Tax=unclassified Streptomyces TaxID=2593676 RepID=UPI002E2B285D|nr:helix-turn-helix domain-containing protein [Streptomyces sp. NBC_00190]WSZ45797.1 hypothetical protein OG239_44340 [Streptomyces sp. NBC_00868]